MVPLVLLELLVHHMVQKLLVLLDQMEFHVFSHSQLDQLLEPNHVELRNVQILLEQPMIYVLDRSLERLVYQMERFVLNKMLVVIIRINYHVMVVELMDFVLSLLLLQQLTH
jgi:hypothetical protein